LSVLDIHSENRDAARNEIALCPDASAVVAAVADEVIQ